MCHSKVIEGRWQGQQIRTKSVDALVGNYDVEANEFFTEGSLLLIIVPDERSYEFRGTVYSKYSPARSYADR